MLLVETDLGAGTMLLERLDPTRSLATLPLAEANHHAGRMMRRLAVRAPSWVLSTGELVQDRLATLRSDWVALGRPVPAGMLAAACTAAETLTSATGDRAVDAALHHEQVLGGEREPWLTVDPCLLRGDIGFDLARCLWDRLHEMPDAATINEQLDIIADAAGLDREHARRSAIFRTIDYWLWGLQHGFTGDPLRSPASRHRAASVTRPSLPRGSRVAMMDRYLIRQAARPQGNPHRTPGAQPVP